MANSTIAFAEAVHGTNPQFLIEKITRLKIYNSVYWKEHCFGLTAETIIDKAISLRYCGGVYGGINKPTRFLCLSLKLLQLQPEKDIVLEFIKNEDFKYLRVLGAFYLRLTGKAEEIYEYLEPLYNDYRKLAYRTSSGWKLIHVDEFIDGLLTAEMMCDITLPHLPKRVKLEQTNALEPRRSVLEDEIDLDSDSIPEGNSVGADEVSQVAAEDDKEVHRPLNQEHPDVKQAAPSPDRKRVPSSLERDRVEKSRLEQHRSRSRERDRGPGRQGHYSRSRSRYRSRRKRRRSSSESSRSRSSDSSRDYRHRGHARRRSSRRRSRSRDRGRHRHSDREMRSRSRSCDRRRIHRRRSRSRSSEHDSRGPSRREKEMIDRRRESPCSDSDLPLETDDTVTSKSKQADKLFDRMFKNNKKGVPSSEISSKPDAAKKFIEGSVEYWNEIRAKQGLKPLRE